MDNDPMSLLWVLLLLATVIPWSGGLHVGEEEFYRSLVLHKKIASVKHAKHIEKVIQASVSGVFVLTGNIGVIKRYVDFFTSHGLFVFVHLEKIGGLHPDKEGLSFVANYVKPTGIISTKSSMIQQAKKLGLLTIQRLFLIDSDALSKGIETFKEVKPDAIELMPGLVPEIVERVKQETEIPVITGGLLSTREQMIAPLKRGAIAVSTGNPELWKEDLSMIHQLG